MKKLTAGLLAAAALTAFAGQARAQTVVGPYLAYHGDFDLGVGAFVTIPIPSIHENISFKGDFGYYFPGEGGFGGVDFTYWEVNADALMAFPLEGNESIRPFAFGGLNIARFSFDEDITGLDIGFGGTEVGLNLGGGISFINVGSVRPSVGAKIELNGGDGFVLFGALGFPVGGGDM
jgi:hypothetical protein